MHSREEALQNSDCLECCFMRNSDSSTSSLDLESV